MNLWDKALKLTLILVFTSFFIACKEELNNVGGINNTDQFNLLFEEFTLPSHVLIDTVSTGQQELLTGKYIDPDFGVISAEAYSAFFGTTATELDDSDIVFDSLMLSLKLEPYYYGAKTETSVSFKIHKVVEEITDLSDKINFSNIVYDSNPIGDTSFILKPTIYDTLLLEETDTINIKLDESYFKEIQDILTTTSNTTLSVSSDSGFYGFAIIASDADKVVGINASSTATKLTIHYHTFDGTTNIDTLEYSYTLFQSGFNKITSDRSGTPIADLKDENAKTPFFPTNGMRYVQNGIGITTEVDFQPFLDFFNDKDNVAINSAAISLGNLESVTDFDAPIGLSLFNTNENSEISALETSGTTLSAVQGDTGSQLYIPYITNEENISGVYYGLPTQYFQFLYNNKVDRSTAIIRPVTFTVDGIFSPVGYTVDRFVINQDSIKLKVYYTTPK